MTGKDLTAKSAKDSQRPQRKSLASITEPLPYGVSCSADFPDGGAKILVSCWLVANGAQNKADLGFGRVLASFPGTNYG